MQNHIGEVDSTKIQLQIVYNIQRRFSILLFRLCEQLLTPIPLKFILIETSQHSSSIKTFSKVLTCSLTYFEKVIFKILTVDVLDTDDYFQS